MTYFLRKTLLMITLYLIAIIRHVQGDCDVSPACGENERCLSCQSVCGGQGFIRADLLFWRAFESGLDTCATNQVSDAITLDGKVISKFSGRGRDPHFTWNPGFRFGVGYELPCSDRDIAASWTHFHSHGNAFKHSANELRWNVNFDVIDIIAGYESDFSPCFALKFFGGLRGARINQELRLGEFPNSTSSFVENELIAISKNNQERFLGIGPLIGLKTNWNIGCDFSVYTNVSLAWLYGNFDVRLVESDESVDAVNLCKLRNYLDASLPAVDVALGICWQKCVCKNTRLTLQLGLEHHCYFDYNRIGNQGDLSFDGLNFSAGIEF